MNIHFASRGRWWPSLCIGTAILAVLFYVILVASNWIYLG